MKPFFQPYVGEHYAAGIRGKKILLVDDVMTSGATFYELNRILRNADVSAVYAVSFCRVVHAI